MTYNAALRVCAAGKRWEGALEVLDEMVRNGVEPDIPSFTAAMAAAVRANHLHVVLEILRTLQNPTMNCINALMTSAQDARQPRCGV